MVGANDKGNLYTRRRTTSDAGLSTTSSMEIDVIGQNVVNERPTETMTMSLTYLVMLNAIVCGLEFCASAAFCYIPPMLLKAGIRCAVVVYCCLLAD